MGKARLFIQDRTSPAPRQYGEDYESEAVARGAGEKLCTNGDAVAFEVWCLAGRYQARVAIERTDDEG